MSNLIINLWNKEQIPVVEALSNKIAINASQLKQNEVAAFVLERIRVEGHNLQLLDTRSKKMKSPENPDPFYPYTHQGLLQEIIHKCAKMNMNSDTIKILEELVSK